MRPNLMSGTDGRVFRWTIGWGWIFTAVEHWNAECVGWNCCKRGDRFAALQPISMGLAGLFPWLDTARLGGWPCEWITAPRHHFTNQIKFWGKPSYAFVAEPQTNGVAERFNRTLKSDHPWSHLPQHQRSLRDAVRLRRTLNFLDRRLKNGYLSPAQVV